MVGITADMRHPNIHILALKTEVFGIGNSNVFSINIAIYATQWFKGGQLICQFDIPKITRMPNLVAIFKMLENCIIKITVGVGY
jgi:hypothetical protein